MTREHNQRFDTVEEALDAWGGYNGHSTNRAVALKLLRQYLDERGTEVDYAYMTPSQHYVAVMFKDDPERVAMYMNFGFVSHDSPTLLYAIRESVQSSSTRWASPLPDNHLRDTLDTQLRRTMDALPHRHCACSPWLHQAPHAIDCSECGAAF